ncbi:hypothetical protein EYF80_062905 [Liparis tanakae]|uniref:Uncharacterized protein n=1 Tax=Liparis tanakae TaxID=230148 RepID=A0A4Z2EF57_9TELE|nr:hypothetical protein EYF80_062905 [Liparis tanakae]
MWTHARAHARTRRTNIQTSRSRLVRNFLFETRWERYPPRARAHKVRTRTRVQTRASMGV